MELSRQIFLEIAAASNKVVSSANDYARRKNRFRVRHSHSQLESEMRRISVACECIAEVLRKSTPLDGPTFDVRLQDWLDTDEPQQCLDTLISTDRMLQQDSSWVSWIFGRGRNTTSDEDKINEAVEYFSSHKGCFHFLFSTSIWNYEKNIQQWQDHDYVPMVQPELHVLDLKGSSLAIRREIHSPNQEDPNFLGKSSKLPVQIALNNKQIMIPITQGCRMVGQKRQGVSNNNEMIDGKLQEVIEWLDGLSCAEKQDDTLSLRQPDTCKWLFDTSQYNMWREGENSFLWLRGKPGAGKSVLASSVINALETSRHLGEILAFFYCDFRRERSTSSAEVLRSILAQLLRGNSVNSESLIKDLSKAKERGGSTRNNAMELAGFTSRVAALTSRRPLVIVDALDECKDVRTLLQALMVIKNSVQLFVTSRPLHLIRRELSGLPFVSLDDMEDELFADIRLHVTRELDARHRLRDLDSRFKAEICLVLCERAGGMFRWIQCSIDTLDRCCTRKEVRSALESLPEGLDETYERILLAIDGKSREGQLARRALTWLVAALRPLQLDELMEGLSINLQTRTLDFDFGPMHHGALLDACGSLVTYSEKTGIINLAHFSVKEYLMGELILAKLPQYQINWEYAHLQLARACIVYLSLNLDVPSGTTASIATNLLNASDEFRDHLNPLLRPLLDYVLNNAVDHFRHLGSSQFQSILHDIERLTHGIQHDSRTWDNLCRSARRAVDPATPTWPPSKHDLTLYILIAYAPNSLLKIVFRPTTRKLKEGMNPLVYAAYFNKEEHARMLLSRGSRLDREGWDINGFVKVFPIEVALQNNHHTMVTLFIEEGSTIPPHIFTDSFPRRDEVNFPSSVARMFFQTDDFVEAVNNPLNEPIPRLDVVFHHLLNTHEHDLLAILQRFIQVVDDDLAHKDEGKQALNFAFATSRISLARYLLSRDASLPSDLFVTPGHWEGGVTTEMVRYLVENGANLHARTTDGDPVLCIALRSVWCPEHHTLEIVKYLVEHGCNPLDAGSSEETPLHIAVRQGLVSVAQYLFSFYVSPPVNLLHTAFTIRNEMEKTSMVVCLLEKGVDVNARIADGDPVLHVAVGSFLDEDYALKTVKALVAHGCNPLEAGSTGETPLHVAVDRGLVSVARYFLLLSGSPSPALVHIALKSRSQEKTKAMIVCLLENGVAVHHDSRFANEDPVLHATLRAFLDEGNALETVKILIKHGCNPSETDSSGKTPLHIAVKRSFFMVTQYLISLGISLPRGLLLLVLESRYVWDKALAPMLVFLLGLGVDIHTHTTEGKPVLHIILHVNWDDEDTALKTVKFFVDHGCDPLEASPAGETPIHIAVKRGLVSVARYLLSLGCSPSADFLRRTSESWLFYNPYLFCLLENGSSDVWHARTEDGDPILFTALQSVWSSDEDYYSLETVKALIRHGCDPLETNSHGESVLNVAVERGFVAVARHLLSLGIPAPPDLLHAVAFNPSMTADTISMIICLIENGVNVHARNADGDPVLHSALQSFNHWSQDRALDVVKILVRHGCNPLDAGSSGAMPLRIAVQRGLVSVTRYLLSLGVPPSPDVLHVALRMDEELGFEREPGWVKRKRFEHNKASMIICLLENGANIHHDPRTAAELELGDPALHIALRWPPIFEEHALNIVKILVCHGCNPLEICSTGETLLHHALGHGNLAIARYLVALGVSLSSDLPALLFNSRTYSSELKMLNYLLNNGIDASSCITAGVPLLHVALQSSMNEESVLETLDLLLRHGCDPLECDSRGQTPLGIAVEHGYISVARFLLSLGPPSESYSLLDLLWVSLRSRPFSHGRKSQMVDFLIDQGASVYAQTCNGDTALHIAISHVRVAEVFEVVELLLRRGCDPTISNDSGVTPFHIAVDRRHICVVELFLSRNVPPPFDILFHAIRSSCPALSSRPALTSRLALSSNAGCPALSPDVRLEMIKMLVTSGCDTQTCDAAGETLLNAAASEGGQDMVDYLISVQESTRPQRPTFGT